MDWKHIRLIKLILYISFLEDILLFICFLYWLYLEEYICSRKTCMLLHLDLAKPVFLISVTPHSLSSRFELYWKVSLVIVTGVSFFYFLV